MINIFLDSNILYSDPFFKEPLNKHALNLAKTGKIKLFISIVALDETFNNFSKLFSEKIENIQREFNKISRIAQTKITITLPKVEDHNLKLRKFFSDLIADDIITQLDYQNNILPELVHRSIHRLRPFSEKRQEFRDAIIWISYIKYIADKSLTNNIFITNNKLDFWDADKIDLHPSLKAEAKDMVIYSGFQDFFSNDPKIHSVTREIEFKTWVEKAHLNNKAIREIIINHLREEIDININEQVNKLTPNNYFPNFDATYFEFQYSLFALSIKGLVIQPISDFAIIDFQLEIPADGIIYPTKFYYHKEKIDFTFVLDISLNLNEKQEITINKIDIIELKQAKK